MYTTGSLRRETLGIPLFSPSLRVAQGVCESAGVSLRNLIDLLNSCGFRRSLKPTSVQTSKPSYAISK